ncbi:unnamed protein product [Phaedon cochleariae]|uniref:Tetratricopeptide repeat protein 1 n=1 Tax=Phaedon cochleariae TaxID=80249 RepID=A0A9N9X1Y9_PHACE|nr:unnamed protein product [Phaedon cochleariae]
MSEQESYENIPTNEELVNDVAKGLESQFCLNNENDPENPKRNATTIVDSDRNIGIPENFEDSDTDNQEDQKPEDYIDEELLKDSELSLSDEEKEKRCKEASELKKQGNEEYKTEKYLESVYTYTKALRICPLKFENDRSILYANRAASKIVLNRKESAIEDCTKAIELNDKYVRAYLRRARLYEESDKLDESLADFKRVLEFDKGNKDALQAQLRLPPLIAERNEKLKTEMLGKLKDLGNMILKPFGLSTNNFQLNQDPNSGGYSVNFTQNQH